MKISKVLFVVLSIIIMAVNCKSARILAIFAAPVVSHQIVFKVLMQELAKRGHEVTVITNLSVTKDLKIDNYTEIDLTEMGNTLRNQLFKNEFSKVPDIFGRFTKTIKMAFKSVDVIFQTDEVRKLIKFKSFDLMFVEDCTRSSLILSHLLKTPVIVVSSFGGGFGTFDMVGGVIHPILYPLAIKERFQNLSMWEKIADLYYHYRFYKIYENFEIMQDETNKRIYGADTPTLSDLKKNVQLLFLNVHTFWDSNRPVPPNVIYVGGLHQTLQSELPKDLKSSLDSSHNGAIYMSFGTSVDTSTFSTSILQTFINVFSKLPYKIYWKWSDEKIPGLPKNIIMANWFPQYDVLRHPNVKLFITQGGLQSTDEAIYAGVPLIGIPIIWDQWFNVDKYVQLNIGMQLDMKTLTEDKLKNAIETVIGNVKYRNNIINLRSLMLDSPQSSLDRAVWWSEYVLRRGATHLRAPSANMSWQDYYEVKIVLVLISIFVISLYVIFIILKVVLRFIIMKLYSAKIKIN